MFFLAHSISRHAQPWRLCLHNKSACRCHQLPTQRQRQRPSPEAVVPHVAAPSAIAALQPLSATCTADVPCRPNSTQLNSPLPLSDWLNMPATHKPHHPHARGAGPAGPASHRALICAQHILSTPRQRHSPTHDPHLCVTPLLVQCGMHTTVLAAPLGTCLIEHALRLTKLQLQHCFS